MKVLVALLRAVNVGGKASLPMETLRSLCAGAGFESVRTHIQSGNVVFRTRDDAAAARARLEAALADHFGRPVGVIMRSGAEMAAVAAANPFADRPGNRVGVLFVDRPPDAVALAALETPGGEAVRAGDRAIYVFFPDGMGRSKLRLPGAETGTMRNMNTVAKLAEMAAETGAATK